jgi:hypothetical protein
MNKTEYRQLVKKDEQVSNRFAIGLIAFIAFLYVLKGLGHEVSIPSVGAWIAASALGGLVSYWLCESHTIENRLEAFIDESIEMHP